MKPRTYEKAKKVWQAKEGNEEAMLVDSIDKGKQLFIQHTRRINQKKKHPASITKRQYDVILPILPGGISFPKRQ